MCNQCLSTEEREQREYLENLRVYIELLPAEVYNENMEYWQSKLAAEENILDNMIDARLKPVLVKYTV